MISAITPASACGNERQRQPGADRNADCCAEHVTDFEHEFRSAAISRVECLERVLPPAQLAAITTAQLGAFEGVINAPASVVNQFSTAQIQAIAIAAFTSASFDALAP